MKKRKFKNCALTVALALAIASLGMCFGACGDKEPPTPAVRPGTFRFEAEESEWYTNPDVAALFIESVATASEGACVGYFREGNSLTFDITATEAEEDVELVLCVSSSVELRQDGVGTVGTKPIPGKMMKHMVKVNGVAPKSWEGRLLGSGTGDDTAPAPEETETPETEGGDTETPSEPIDPTDPTDPEEPIEPEPPKGENPYLNYYVFCRVSTRISLCAGVNRITITSIGASFNWDYIELTTAKAGLSWKPSANY